MASLSTTSVLLALVIMAWIAQSTAAPLYPNLEYPTLSPVRLSHIRQQIQLGIDAPTRYIRLDDLLETPGATAGEVIAPSYDRHIEKEPPALQEVVEVTTRWLDGAICWLGSLAGFSREHRGLMGGI